MKFILHWFAALSLSRAVLNESYIITSIEEDRRKASVFKCIKTLAPCMFRSYHIAIASDTVIALNCWQ